MNKTFLLVAQVFAILGAVGYGIGALAYLSLLSFSFVGLILPTAIFYVAFIVLNIIAAINLDKARNDQLSPQATLGWSIYLIIGAGVIGGIFGILGSQGVGVDSATKQAPTKGLEAKLEELDRLYNRGLITRDEYLARRKKIILED